MILALRPLAALAVVVAMLGCGDAPTSGVEAQIDALFGAPPFGTVNRDRRGASSRRSPGTTGRSSWRTSSATARTRSIATDARPT
jgi:hypothetical protein